MLAVAEHPQHLVADGKETGILRHTFAKLLCQEGAHKPAPQLLLRELPDRRERLQASDGGTGRTLPGHPLGRRARAAPLESLQPLAEQEKKVIGAADAGHLS